MCWTTYENGTTIGTPGSEGGVTLRDEEHDSGARITLEDSRKPPFSITCGIYGVMVHTAFAGAAEEANRIYEAMKIDLDELLNLWPEEATASNSTDRFYDAVSAFVTKYE
jgi:hypothetical protein